MPLDGGFARDPRLAMERIRLIFFVGRHILGVCLFLWLTVECFLRDAPQLGYLFLVLTPAYAAFALVTGRILLRRFRQMARRRATATFAGGSEH